jgi:hypothetical protein
MPSYTAFFAMRRVEQMRAFKAFQTFVVLAFLVGHASAARAQSTFPLTVSDRTATAVIELPGGYAADLSLEFEDVVGLHAGALEVSARVLSPLDVLALLPRFPGGSATTIPTSFPVLLQIEPTSTSALSMAGIVTISLHTHNLTLNPTSPLGLYSAPSGGPFREITRRVGIGSYRVDGSGGGFSEFVIADDRRPLDTVIAGKFNTLQQALTDYASLIPPAVLTQLQQQLGLAQSLYGAGQVTLAIVAIEGFGDTVKAHSGGEIPDVWSAHRDTTNVAGLLRSLADALRFRLVVAASRLP